MDCYQRLEVEKEKNIKDYVWDKHTPNDVLERIVLERITEFNLDISCRITKV
jgi:hypothetical protein